MSVWEKTKREQGRLRQPSDHAAVWPPAQGGEAGVCILDGLAAWRGVSRAMEEPSSQWRPSQECPRCARSLAGARPWSVALERRVVNYALCLEDGKAHAYGHHGHFLVNKFDNVQEKI